MARPRPHLSPESGNVVLVGMPGSGKSTLGVLLAKATSRDFMDTDVVIQAREGRILQDILDDIGPTGFRRVEEEALLSLDQRHTVIATGGSAVYSESGMRHLQTSSTIVFLELSLQPLLARLANLPTRGVVRVAGQTIEDLYAERRPLYERYADLTIPCDGLGHEEAVASVMHALGEAR